jgi:hypothetical protein
LLNECVHSKRGDQQRAINSCNSGIHVILRMRCVQPSLQEAKIEQETKQIKQTNKQTNKKTKKANKQYKSNCHFGRAPRAVTARKLSMWLEPRAVTAREVQESLEIQRPRVVSVAVVIVTLGNLHAPQSVDRVPRERRVACERSNGVHGCDARTVHGTSALTRRGMEVVAHAWRSTRSKERKQRVRHGHLW